MAEHLRYHILAWGQGTIQSGSVEMSGGVAVKSLRSSQIVSGRPGGDVINGADVCGGG